MELRRLRRLEEKGVEEEEEGEAGSEQEKQEPHLKNTWLLAQFGAVSYTHLTLPTKA